MGRGEMTAYKTLEKAMALPRIPNREAMRQRAWAEYKQAVEWYYPMFRVLGAQFVLMLTVVKVWG